MFRNGAIKASNYLYRLHSKCFYRCATLSCQKRSAFPTKCTPWGPFRGQWRHILHPWRVDAANTILNTKTGFSLKVRSRKLFCFAMSVQWSRVRSVRSLLSHPWLGATEIPLSQCFHRSTVFRCEAVFRQTRLRTDSKYFCARKKFEA